MTFRFVGGDRIQRGRGIGGILRLASKLFSPVTNVVKSVLRSNTGKQIGTAVKEQAVSSGINLATDIANGRNVKESLLAEMKNVKKAAKRKAAEIVLDNLKPDEIVPKKKVKKKKKTTLKRKKDIFS